ncbi:MAG: BrnT family toxin [Anaerolineales bacterium]|nr:BrnT family toxin [Anaerolineales bacterium]
MEFEWDSNKAKRNLENHGVDFQDAILAFFDPHKLEDIDDFLDEERYRLIGIANGRLLLIVYTWREDRIRMISARKATRYERQQYYAN